MTIPSDASDKDEMGTVSLSRLFKKQETLFEFSELLRAIAELFSFYKVKVFCSS